MVLSFYITLLVKYSKDSCQEEAKLGTREGVTGNFVFLLIKTQNLHCKCSKLDLILYLIPYIQSLSRFKPGGAGGAAEDGGRVDHNWCNLSYIPIRDGPLEK